MRRLSKTVLLALLALVVVPPLAARFAGWGSDPTLRPAPGHSLPIRGDRRVNVVRVGEGKPVVLVHGRAGCAADWGSVPKRLAQLGHQVISYDRVGHGFSSRPEGGASAFDWQAHALDLEGLLDALGLERAALVGWDEGGAIVQSLALRAPERVSHLALVASTGPGDPRDESLVDRALSSRLGPALLAWASAVPQVSDRVVRNHLLRSFSRERDIPVGWSDYSLAMLTLPGTLHTIRMESKSDREDLLRLEEITPPTLVLHGVDDFVIPYAVAEQLHSRIPNSVLETVLEGSHMLPVTHPELVAEQVHALVGSMYDEGLLSDSQPPTEGPLEAPLEGLAFEKPGASGAAIEVETAGASGPSPSPPPAAPAQP